MEGNRGELTLYRPLKTYFDGFWRSLASDYKVFAEGPQDAEWMRQNFRESALPAFSYYFLLVLSTLISTLGLIANSSATIIGGMIISPLMHPIVTLAFGITIRDRRLIDRGAVMLLTGIPLCILVAYVFSTIINIRVVGSEVLSRSNPNYLDLGVALGAGASGAFSYSRKSIANALPGVAIAVALVPPLCVVGIGAHAGLLGDLMASNAGIDEDMAIGSLTLFLTNLWGILVAAIIVFLCQKYGDFRGAFRGLLVSVVVLAGLLYPLGTSFYKMYIRELFYRELLRFRAHETRFSEAELHQVDIRLLRGKYRVHMTLFSNVDKLDDLSDTQEKIDLLSKRMAKRLGHPVRIELNVIPLYNVRSSPSLEKETPPPTEGSS